jgi:cytoskeletal protein RodZ
MEDLGKYLREQRELSGISYAQIWQDIRIKEEQIKSIEENNLFELGDFGFVKVLIFNYARYLNADAEKVMNEFHVLMPDTIKQRFHPAKL